MSTKEVSNFYFFKSKKTTKVRIPIHEQFPSPLQLVSCICGNSFALWVTQKLSPCPLCASSDVKSVKEFEGSPTGRMELTDEIDARNKAAEDALIRQPGPVNFDNIPQFERRRRGITLPPLLSDEKFESQVKSWLHIGTADLPKLNSTNMGKKYNSFLSKNNVYPVKQSPGRANWYPPSRHENCEFYFIGPEAKFRTKGPYEIHNRRTGPGIYFYYKGRLYLSDSKEEVVAHVDGVGTKEDDDSRRERIPDDTQIFVWKRDGGACVKCGSKENLAFDHIIPHSRGGSNSRRNLQLLCDSCNSKKGNKIGG